MGNANKLREIWKQAREERIQRRAPDGHYQVATYRDGDPASPYINDYPSIQVAIKRGKESLTLGGVSKVVIYDSLGNFFKKVGSQGSKSAGRGARLDSKLRGKINLIFSRDKGLNGNRPWAKPQQGFAHAIEILLAHGIQMDQVVNNFEFEKAMNGTVRVGLAFTNEADPFSPVQIDNSMLIISYAPFGDSPVGASRTETRFEVIAYLS